MKFIIRLMLLFILSFTFLTSSYSFVRAESLQKDDSKSLEIMAALKVIEVDDINSVDLTQNVTKAQFCSYIANELGLGDTSSNYAPAFTDIPSGYWAAGTISALSKLGILSGNKDGTFNPEDGISFNQAVKMCVIALGYENYANAKGGYPVGYLAMASQLGLIKGMGSDVERKLTLGEAAKLLYNSIDVDLMSQNGYGNKSIFSIDKGKTLLTEKLHMYKDYGIVRANKDTALNSPESGLSNGWVRIDDENFMEGDTNASSLLGSYVEFYSTDGSNNTDKVLKYVHVDSRNNVITLDPQYIKDFSGMKYQYNKDDKSEDYTLKRSADVIVNGKAFPQYTAQHLVPDIGWVKLIDNDGDGNFEVAIIYSVNNYVVNNVTSEGDVYDVLGSTPLNLDNMSGNVENVITYDGEIASYGQIVRYDVLSVAESLNSEGRKLRSVKIINTKISGKIEEVQSSAFTDGGLTADVVDKIKISGKEYAISKSMRKAILHNNKNIKDLKLNTSGTICLDEFGNVAYFDMDNFGEDQYGFAIKCAKTPGINQQVQLRIICSNGEWATITCEDKLEIDGYQNMDSDNVIKVLSGNDNVFLPQLIHYKLNPAGKIFMLDTTNTTDKEDKSTCLRSSNLNANNNRYTYKRSSRCFDGEFSISNRCIVFCVPGPGYQTDETLYKVANAGYFSDGQNYNVQPYNVGEALVADLAVVLGATSGSDIPGDVTLAVVDKVSKVITNKGDEVACIYGIKDEKPFNFILRDSDVMLVDRTDSDKKKDCYSTLKKGDVIRFTLDNSNSILEIERLVDVYTLKNSNYLNLKGSYSSTGGYRDGSFLRCGLVYSRQDDIIALTTSPSQSLSAITPDTLGNYAVTYSVQPPKIMVYDEENNKVRAGTPSDVVPYMEVNDPSKTSLIYMHTTYGDPKDLVIFKFKY